MGNRKLHTLRWFSRWHYHRAYAHTFVSTQLFVHMGMAGLVSLHKFAYYQTSNNLLH